jgi:hypothetical protein
MHEFLTEMNEQLAKDACQLAQARVSAMTETQRARLRIALLGARLAIEALEGWEEEGLIERRERRAYMYQLRKRAAEAPLRRRAELYDEVEELEKVHFEERQWFLSSLDAQLGELDTDQDLAESWNYLLQLWTFRLEEDENSAAFWDRLIGIAEA